MKGKEIFKLNNVIIKPTGGLANRMRVLESAYNYSIAYKSNLIIIWERNSDLNAKFSDCLEDIPGVKVIDLNFSGRNTFSKIRRKVLLFWQFFYTSYNANKKVVDEEIKAIENYKDEKVLEKLFVEYAKENKGLYLYICYSFYSNYNNFFVKINKKVADKGKYLLQDVGQITGVHIRRTDHVESIENSPLQLFIDEIKSVLSEFPAMKFYLSTDSDEVVDQLKEEFNDIIITGVTNRSRDTKDGIESALLDLYCLSCCKEILGSHNSTFSERAALMGNIPLRIVSK